MEQERKTIKDRVPIRPDKLEILRQKSRETGITQTRLVDDLLEQAMRQRRWITDDVEVCA